MAQFTYWYHHFEKEAVSAQEITPQETTVAQSTVLESLQDEVKRTDKAPVGPTPNEVPTGSSQVHCKRLIEYFTEKKKKSLIKES